MEMTCPDCGMCETHGDNMMEVKQRLDAKCWKGKHKEGTKIKGGIRVNNCVAEGLEQEGSTFKNSLHTIIRVATHLERQMSDDENFPEWESEMIGSVKDQMVKIMDYEISKKEQGVAEGGPFSYGKPPRKGSVADLAAKRRQEQDRKTPPIEPKDQMVGNAKVTKDTKEGLKQMLRKVDPTIKSRLRSKADRLDDEGDEVHQDLKSMGMEPQDAMTRNMDPEKYYRNADRYRRLTNKKEGVAEATGDEKFDKTMRKATGNITPDDAAGYWPTKEYEPIDLDPSYLPSMDKYKAQLYPLAYRWWSDSGDGTEEAQLRKLGWEPSYGDDYVMVVLSGIGHDGHIQYDIHDFDAEGEDLDEQGVAEDNLKEFAPGNGGGESGRWYTDDQMTD
jgi:hypothetical protein